MIPYLLHASILLAGCFLFYWFLIRTETFFRLNRGLLIGSILLSLLVPLVTIPADWSLRNPPVIEISEPLIIASKAPISKTREDKQEAELTDHTGIVSPDESKGIIALADNTTTLAETSLLGQSKNNGFTKLLPTLLWYTYLLGVGVFFIGFLVQLIILITKMYSLISFKDGPYRIVELVKDEAPYSFWNSIFINPTKYDLDTYTQIIDHEKIHIQQAHFVDKLLAEFLLIAFWFNPFVWLLRSAITNNLEYLTDSSMLKNGTEKTSYQLSLLKVSVPQHPLNLSTNYNNSFLKNRIAMMNSKKSSARSSWKYLFLLPLLSLSVLYLNAVDINNDITNNSFDETVSENQLSSNTNIKDQTIDKESNTSKPTTKKDSIPVIPSRSGESHSSSSSSSSSSTTTHDGVGTNSHVDTHINLGQGAMTTTHSQSNTSTQGSDNKSVTINKSIHIDGDNVTIIEESSNNPWSNNIRPGHWEGNISNDKVCFYINNSNSSKNSTWITTACFNRSELSALPMNSGQDFYIKREAGTLNLNGSFSGTKGEGTFSFKTDDSFMNYLAKNGMKIKREPDLFHLFLGGIDKEYIGYLRSAGFKADGRDLIDLAIHGVDKNAAQGYVKVFKDLKYKNYKVRDLIQFQIHDVSPEYVNEIRTQGVIDLTVEEIVQARIHDVDPTFIKSVKEYGLDLYLQEIIQFSIHDVDASYIMALKNTGFTNLTYGDIVQAKIHDVSPEFIRAIQSTGMKNMKMEDLVQFSIHDVSADYIKGFKEAGIKDLSDGDIIQASIHGVDIDFVKKLKAYGISDLTMGEVVQCAVHNVSADNIRDFKKIGFDHLTVDEMVQAQIHDVSPKFIKSLQRLGFNDKDISDFTQARVHGVTAQFVERARKKGHKATDLQDCVQLKVRGI
ncbi:MAG: hypothetical protein ACI9XB_001701 [Gammaproteobacteria bacterium]|jgi:hypothetical protein